MGGMSKIVKNARARVDEFRSIFGDQCIFGWVEQQTLGTEITMISLLPRKRPWSLRPLLAIF